MPRTEKLQDYILLHHNVPLINTGSTCSDKNAKSHTCTRGVQKVLQIDIQKIHIALEFDFI